MHGVRGSGHKHVWQCVVAADGRALHPAHILQQQRTFCNRQAREGRVQRWAMPLQPSEVWRRWVVLTVSASRPIACGAVEVNDEVNTAKPGAAPRVAVERGR